MKPSSFRIADLLEQAYEAEPRHLLLCIDHFEAILDDPPGLDARYDVTFLNQLNALRNSAHARLLCVTFEPQSLSSFRGQSSWLDLEKLYLGDLTESQIAGELNRYYPELPANLRTYLVEQIETEPDPMCLLDGLQSSLPGMDLQLDKLKIKVKDLKRNLGSYGK